MENFPNCPLCSCLGSYHTPLPHPHPRLKFCGIRIISFYQSSPMHAVPQRYASAQQGCDHLQALTLAVCQGTRAQTEIF